MHELSMLTELSLQRQVLVFDVDQLPVLFFELSFEGGDEVGVPVVLGLKGGQLVL
jgi:hypothetical protein